MSIFTDSGLERILDAIAYIGDPFTHPVPGWAQDCDCLRDPHHRWNCELAPIWEQTMRELDCNPWTVVRDENGFKGTNCGRGPCCLGCDHDGRCRM